MKHACGAGWYPARRLEIGAVFIRGSMLSSMAADLALESVAY
jgi:hypothetical protein